MAWEQRGSRRYYSRTRRVGGRRVRQYYGNDERAELAAAEDEYRQTLRTLTRNANPRRGTDSPGITRSTRLLNEI
jgi:hypothetical protein